jgi:hypothetical protein
VRKGTALWQPIANGSTLFFLSAIVASITLKARQHYRFIVAPGQYVLTSGYLSSGVGAWDNVTVNAAETVTADLDPMCK